MKDVVIIGGGPAGLTASIYAVRAGLSAVLVEMYSPGGQVMKTFEVENYPGFEKPVAGWELMSAMEAQARRLEADITSASVSSLLKDDETNLFTVKFSDGTEVRSKTVIAAPGASLKKLGIEGEERLTGRGVSYCATCDGAFFKNRITAVVGGGDTALEEALFLTGFSSRVYLIHRRESFRGADILQKRVFASEKIVPVYNSKPVEVKGVNSVEGLVLENTVSGERSELNIDGVFIFIGYQPNSSFLPYEILNDKGEVIVDGGMRTSVDGLFAAGDVRSESKRQIVTAAADGATAALNAYDYIQCHDFC